MAYTTRQIEQARNDAYTYERYYRCEQDTTATMRAECLARNTVKNRVRRTRSRLHNAAADVALSYAFFEGEHPGKKLQPLDREYAFSVLRSMYGREYAQAVMWNGEHVIERAQRMLPAKRRQVEEYA